MRIISIITAIVAFTISVSAQPLLVGHRGSIWGLENSSEAFINGAKKGYHYLETDVKVTKDGKHVCCHNDDLTTWGGTLTIASSTLEQLQAETLTQTRSGVTYTGHLCSLEEYLDICKEHNVKPLIELKWATGINSNDCSGIPALIKVIEDKGFRSTCIILTSMKPCLEYIRTNYSDIELQLLCYSSSFESSFDWCKTWEIDIDSAIGSEISQDLVNKYHDAGLKVNVWTVNDNTHYSIYGGYGCDFITTDYLNPENLPEIKPEEESNFKLDVVWEKSTTLGNAPSNIDGTNAQQGSAHNGIFYVNNCSEKKLHIFGEDAQYLGNINGGSGWGCDCDDAGNIIIRNDKETGTDHKFIIYPAGTTVKNPGTPIETDVTLPLSGQTNFISASGNVLGKEGGYIYMFPNKQNAVCVITMKEGQVTTVNSYSNLSITGSTAGYVIPMENNPQKWIYQVRSNGYYSYNQGTNTPYMAGSASTTAPARNSSVGGEYFKFKNHEIFLHCSGLNYKGGFTIRDITDGKVIANIEPIGTLGYETGGNYSVSNWVRAEKIDDNSYYIYQYCPANGMAVYRLYDKNSTSAIEETFTAETGKLSIYPNPATDAVNILADEEITAISLFNISGALLNTEAEINGNTARMNIEELPAGTYILRVNDKSAKLIKK